MKAGWRTEPLNAVCQLINRGVSPAYVENGGVAVLNQKCVRGHTVNFDLGRRHNAAEKKVSTDKFLRAGDVLVNSTGTGTLGRVAQLRAAPVEPTTVDSHVTIVRPKDELFHSEFFGYALIAIEEKIQEGGEGCGGQTELARSKLANDFYVSFPEDIRAQQRIVTILDEAFDGIATAKANAEKNLQNARAIFESHLQSVFTKAWGAGNLVTLADLTTDITDGDHMPPPKAETGIAFITIGNIDKSTRTIDFSDTFKVSKTYFDGLKPNKKPKKGDVLYTVTGSFGIPVLVTENREFCFQRHVGLVRPKSDVNSEWLYYLLMSPQVVKQANDGATGTAQKTVSLKLLRGFEVPRVPLVDQQGVVSKLNAVFEETQRLESLYQRKLQALDDLKKSLLHQAFSGGV